MLRMSILVGALSLGGCNPSELPSQDPLPAPPLVVAPDDLQTSSEGVVRFDVEASSELAVEDAVQRLTSGLVINNLATGAVQRFTTGRESHPGATAPSTRVAFRPTGEMLGWFSLNTPELSDARFTSASGFPITLTDSSRVRFGVGVAPVLARVEVCSPADAFPYVQFVFSEPVRLSESARLAWAVEFRSGTGELLPCEEIAGGGPLEEGYAKRKWSFACSVPEFFQVALAPEGIESAESRMPLTHFADGEAGVFLDVDLRDSNRQGECQLFAPW